MTSEVFNRDFNDFVNIENAQSNNTNSIELGIIIAKQLAKKLEVKLNLLIKRAKVLSMSLLLDKRLEVLNL